MKFYFSCPNCGNDEGFTRPREQGQGLGWLLLLLGHLLLALLYADSVSRRAQCSKCGYIFRQPPLPRTPVSAFALWIVGIVFLFLAIGFVGVLALGTTEALPPIPILDQVERMIAENPRVVTLTLISMTVVIIAVCLVVSCASNWRAHRRLKQEFETTPQL